MGLTYHYAFGASGNTSATNLEEFLHGVEVAAKELGFDPVLVLDAQFDSLERKKFARQLTAGARIESEKLKGVVMLRDGQVWSHDPVTGSCRVIPKRGIILVVTDAQKRETIFGFFQFPDTLKDLNGKNVVNTHLGDRWTFQGFVNSPDPRFRQIVKLFSAAGYLEAERDEFNKDL
jgi:hypothetical protein